MTPPLAPYVRPAIPAENCAIGRRWIAQIRDRRQLERQRNALAAIGRATTRTATTEGHRS